MFISKIEEIREREKAIKEKTKWEKKEKLTTLTIWLSIFILIVGGLFLMLKLVKMPVKITGFQDNTNIAFFVFLFLLVFLCFLFLIIIPLYRKKEEVVYSKYSE